MSSRYITVYVNDTKVRCYGGDTETINKILYSYLYGHVDKTELFRNQYATKLDIKIRVITKNHSKTKRGTETRGYMTKEPGVGMILTKIESVEQRSIRVSYYDVEHKVVALKYSDKLQQLIKEFMTSKKTSEISKEKNEQTSKEKENN